VPDCAIFAADVLLLAILFSKNVLGGTAASHTSLVWGAVIFSSSPTITLLIFVQLRFALKNSLNLSRVLVRFDHVARVIAN
jgi:hypothetical protein